MFPLHTVDLYFWTPEDAELFLDSLKRVLAPGQLRILDANTTHPEHRDSMSPVVQQLERVAVSTPPQQQQRSNSISTTHSATNPTTVAPVPVPGNAAVSGTVHTPVSPPISPPAPQDGQQHPPQQPAQQQQQVPPPQQAAPATTYAPMAYNPAAPAAPEPIAHREKTPPPADGDSGTGLNATAAHEVGTRPVAQQPGFMMAANPLQQSFGPQPTSGPYVPGPGIQRANTVAFGEQLPAVPGAQQQPQIHMQGQQPHPAMPPPLQSRSPYSPGFQAPPTDPNAHLYAQQASPSPGLMRQSTLPPGYVAATGGGYVSGAPQQHSPQGYAGYQTSAAGVYGGVPASLGTPVSPGMYNPGQQQQQQQMYIAAAQAGQQPSYLQHQQAAGAQQQASAYGVSHSMHQQAYVPEGKTEAAKPGPGQEAATGKLEQRMLGAEKGLSAGIGKFLKKLDKKI
jgi:hypothetical protein